MKTFIIIVLLIVTWMIISYFKNRKDPDVIAASKLRLPMWEYNKYKRFAIRLMELGEKYSQDSPEIRAFMAENHELLQRPDIAMAVYEEVVRQEEQGILDKNDLS